jgi:hypothetical protein
MARPQQQGVAEKLLEVLENARFARRVKAMAAVVHPQAFQRKAAGVTSHLSMLLDYGNSSQVSAGKLESRTQAGGPGTEDDGVGSHKGLLAASRRNKAACEETTR